MLLVWMCAWADELRDVADRWAPNIYQDVADGPWNDADLRRQDLLTTVNYDGNFDAFDNEENIDDFTLPPAVYYDIVETETHYFILYSFFHPIDWNDAGFVDHENDMEHAWLVVEKHLDGTQTLLVAHTQAHGQFFGWSESDLTGNFQLAKGGLSMDGDHVQLFIEAHGHGPASCTYSGGLPFTRSIDCSPDASEDLVIFRVEPGVEANTLAEPDVSDGGIVESGYALVSAHDVLWPLRSNIEDTHADPEVWDDPFRYAPARNADFDSGNDVVMAAGLANFGGNFAGDEGGGGGVPPWGYLADDSWTGGNTFGAQGDWLIDPAELFSILYRNYACSDREAFFNYLANPYIDDVVDAAAPRPWGGVDEGRRCDGTVTAAPDSGGDSGGDTGRASEDTGHGGQADTNSDADAPPDSSGNACGCVAAMTSPPSGFAWVLFVAVLTTANRRRRRNS